MAELQKKQGKPVSQTLGGNFSKLLLSLPIDDRLALYKSECKKMKQLEQKITPIWTKKEHGALKKERRFTSILIITV